MRHITDHTLSLNLNPRQIYIIVRKHNKRFLRTFQSLARESENDDIRFCVIDTTAFKMQPETTNNLYCQFLGQDEEDCPPWDFIVRDYPHERKSFSFTCEHILHNTAAEIREQLEEMRSRHENEIWNSVTRVFNEKISKPSLVVAKRNAFYDSLCAIQRAQGYSDGTDEENIHKLIRCLRDWHRESEHKALVREFIGDQMLLMDDFMHLNTSRERSDQYMKTFMETGGHIFHPSLRIVESTGVKTGIHARFSLEIRTWTGEVFYPKFKMADAFAFYILCMKNPGIHFSMKDFCQGTLCKNLCQQLAAIYATIGENLYNSGGASLAEPKRRCREFIQKLQEEDVKVWQNITYRCDEAIKNAMGEQREPFMLFPLGNGKKEERWISMREEYVDLSADKFESSRKKNFELLKGLFDDMCRY